MSSKGTVSSVPARVRADSGTNLFKQGQIVASRPCGSVAQLARVLARCARGPGFESRSGHVCFFSPCDISIILIAVQASNCWFSFAPAFQLFRAVKSLSLFHLCN